MNRALLIGLVAVAGLSLYVSMQTDDDLLAPGKQGARDRAAGRSAGQTIKASKQPDRQQGRKDAWVGAALISGVKQWQGRGTQADDIHELLGLGQYAWGSMRPAQPPPSPVVQVETAPPPPPMAPRFPLAWVGRFNDEPGPFAASSASGVAEQTVQRAVLVGPQSTWVVRAGDVIEGQWRVDRIQNRTMSLTYLPLQQQQTVVMR